MRVFVCGGRTFNDEHLVSDILLQIAPSVVIQGNAAGADDIAKRWAEANHVSVMSFSADWGTFGKAAGPIRNKRMLDEGKPDLVVAFPGGKGTANMVKLAREAGIKVVEVEGISRYV